MYLCDTHSHTKVSHDSQADLSDMVRAARRAGLRELCVTDHCDLLDLDGRLLARFDWPAAKAQYRAARALAGDGLTLRLGLELGSTPCDPAAARDILAQGGDELDFVLGSLHNWIGTEGGRDLYYSDYGRTPGLARKAVESTLAHTWTLVTQSPDCYDSLAHIVYPLRYIHRDGVDMSLADFEEQVRAIFTQVAASGHAIELNTCRGHDLDCWPPLLRWFKECGGELVTVGADAHRPDQVGRGIPEALDMLKAAGFGYVAAYERRKPVLHRL